MVKAKCYNLLLQTLALRAPVLPDLFTACRTELNWIDGVLGDLDIADPPPSMLQEIQTGLALGLNSLRVHQGLEPIASDAIIEALEEDG